MLAVFFLLILLLFVLILILSTNGVIIIDLRYYGTTGKPHENAKIIAGMIKNELEQLGYDFAKENT